MADVKASEKYASIRDGILPKASKLVQMPTSIQEDGVGIRVIFRATLFALAVVAMIGIYGISFGRISDSELADATIFMKSEANYLRLQLASLDKRVGAFEDVVSSAGLEQGRVAESDFDLLTDRVGDLLDGYTVAQNGTVLIAQDSVVIETDDERVGEGTRLEEALGADVVGVIEASISEGGAQKIVLGKAFADEADSAAYLVAARQGAYTIVIIQSEDLIFSNRSSILNGGTFRLNMVILLILFAVDLMLYLVAVRRIDRTNETLQKIVAGDLDARVACEGAREFRSLSKGINLTVDALNGWIGEAERRMEDELETASRIQMGTLPNRFPVFPEIDAIDLYASVDPAREVGGDFYDFFKLSDRKIAFVIADVSGKGIPGALFMMQAKTEFENRERDGLSLGESVCIANDYLCANNEAGMFVTAWMAVLDFTTGDLTYVNAGHNYPLLRHDGQWRWIDQTCGLFMGSFPGIPYREERLKLAPGDQLLLYTDGVNEAFNVEGKQYGNDRLERFLAAHADLSPEELVHALRADVAAWAEGTEQSDDVTIMSLAMR